MEKSQVIIIGGGISGLINAIVLSRAGFQVFLLERNSYPFHRVCGEYISNEVVPFLVNHNLFPGGYYPAEISRLEITAISGKSFRMPLDLGGFGISRYKFDKFLAEEARRSGARILENHTVKAVHFDENKFIVTCSNNQFQADLVIGAQGKRSTLDKQLSRDFLKQRSPYVGVKYHLKGEFEENTISLHNFDGGYCGFNKIEDGKYNLCYLINREKVRQMGNIQRCEENILLRNPKLKRIFETGEFLFEKPLIVNEVSFSSKGLSKDGLIFTGDAAGTIAPLSGNGMAMAIRSAKYLSESIIKFWNTTSDQKKILDHYKHLWQAEFGKRISRGRKIQKLFGNALISEAAVKSGRIFPQLVSPLVRMTHGQPFG